MPSSATITAFYSFTASTVNSPQIIKSAEVNNNFNVFRGHVIPIDPNTATAAPTLTYDLGSEEYRWRRSYTKVYPSIVSTTGSITLVSTQDIVRVAPASGGSTCTVSLPAISGCTGCSFTIKHAGTTATVFLDGNSSETIDGTIGVNLIQGESRTIINYGSGWESI